MLTDTENNKTQEENILLTGYLYGILPYHFPELAYGQLQEKPELSRAKQPPLLTGRNSFFLDWKGRR